MHLLLPPSEGKSPGGRGRPLRMRSDTGPLAQARSIVLAAVQDLVAADADIAAAALQLPAGRAAEALHANAAVLDAPTMPALRRYAGTVYAGLDMATLPPAQQRLAARSALIFSGLFGVLRGDEPVPVYRVPAAASLPGIGTAASFWRPVLRDAVPVLLGRRGLVIDLRSTDYAAMWRPPAPLRSRVLTVRIRSPLPGGGHGVVSYASKLGKGRLARALVERVAAGRPVADAGDVCTAWETCGGAGAQVTDTGVDLVTH